MFAKAPRPGRVKTRLAAALGSDEAASFHRECALATWERIGAFPRVDPYFYCDVWWPEFAAAGGGRYRLQRGADLGDKMRNCLDELLGAGHRCALLVGSDAPTLPSAQIREALGCLGPCEAVLGPAEDGGFSLIAAVRTAPGMFRGVAWSRKDTCDVCLKALRAAGLRAAVTPTSAYDIDGLSDLHRLRMDPGLPPRLRRWFVSRGPTFS